LRFPGVCVERDRGFSRTSCTLYWIFFLTVALCYRPSRRRKSDSRCRGNSKYLRPF
jgi:hypothetical protein